MSILRVGLKACVVHVERLVDMFLGVLIETHARAALHNHAKKDVVQAAILAYAAWCAKTLRVCNIVYHNALLQCLSVGIILLEAAQGDIGTET